MGVVDIAHFHAGALSVETAGTERGELTLVRELRYGIVMVHELRQLRGAEELLDCRSHGLNVDKALSSVLSVVGDYAHALFDNSVKSAEAYA